MIQFVHFDEKYIPQMAGILAARHLAERQRIPFLPARFEKKEGAAEALRSQVNKPFSAGIVALRDDELIGYMLYEFKQNEILGRYIEVDYPSLAIKEDEHPRLVRLLYAEAGAEWVRNGYFEHVIFAPIGHNGIILELLEQSFTFDQRYAILPLATYTSKSDGDADVNFREVKKSDVGLLRELAHWNSVHQAMAPSWNPITRESLAEIRQSYVGLADDPDVKMWIAEQQGEPVAFHVYYPAETEDSMVTPHAAAQLPAGATHISSRGKGIGKALANHCFGQLKAEGFQYILSDWHTPNHLASYFWPSLGFQSYMIRMVRSVDPRITWANGVKS